MNNYTIINEVKTNIQNDIEITKRQIDLLFKDLKEALGKEDYPQIQLTAEQLLREATAYCTADYLVKEYIMYIEE